MVCAHLCFASPCLTHSGINDEHTTETELHLREFLSALHELDIRVCHKDLSSKTCQKDTEPWWMKSNYMSLFNLLWTMHNLGPLVLWWDGGGGEGEAFIQIVKPFLTNGVRGDTEMFFNRKMESTHQKTVLSLLENRCQSNGSDLEDNCLSWEQLSTFMEVVEEIIETVGQFFMVTGEGKRGNGRTTRVR